MRGEPGWCVLHQSRASGSALELHGRDVFATLPVPSLLRPRARPGFLMPSQPSWQACWKTVRPQSCARGARSAARRVGLSAGCSMPACSPRLALSALALPNPVAAERSSLHRLAPYPPRDRLGKMAAAPTCRLGVSPRRQCWPGCVSAGSARASAGLPALTRDRAAIATRVPPYPVERSQRPSVSRSRAAASSRSAS